VAAQPTRPSAEQRHKAEKDLAMATATVITHHSPDEEGLHVFRMAYTLGAVEAIVDGLDRHHGDDAYTALALARIRARVEAYSRRAYSD
jgi:hypothetical protein